MNAIKKIILAVFITTGVISLSGCQLGVLELDIGIGFEEGAYVISE
ncbi:MAG TPA: hypothetical protein VIM85_03445 [Pseudomonadales bacterium]